MIDVRQKKRSYYALLMPAFLVYISVIIFPILMSLGLSFTKWKQYRLVGFVGLENYINILKDPVFRHSA